MKRQEALDKLVYNGKKSYSVLKDFQQHSLIKNEKTVSSYRKSSYSWFCFLALHAYIVNHDPKAYRLWMHHAALSKHTRAAVDKGVGGLMTTLAHAYAPLMSDNLAAAHAMTRWRSMYEEEEEKRGTIFSIAKQLILGNRERADELWHKGSSHLQKKLHYFMEERRAIRAVIDRDEETLTTVLYEMLEPELHKKNLDSTFVSGYFYNDLVLTYIKFAQFVGMDIKINHELVPKELASFAPLESYEVQYEFMKAVEL